MLDTITAVIVEFPGPQGPAGSATSFGWFDPADYGAIGDGTTNDTAALQATIVAAAASTGGVVLLKDTYKSGNLDITNAVDFVIKGPGKIVWTGTASGSNYIGLRLVGTCTNVTVDGITFAGDGVLGNRHAGVWYNSGQNFKNIKILNNKVTDVVVGISMGAGGGGTFDGGLIQGNYIDNVIGTTPGIGYGIHHGTASTSACNMKIIGNTISRAQRHGIYQAEGVGVSIIGNTIRDHRTTVTDDSQRAALAVSRSSAVTVSNNTLVNCYDGQIEVSLEATYSAKGVVVSNNTMLNIKSAAIAILIGTGSPATDGYPEEVVVTGNTLYSTGVAFKGMDIQSGKRITITNNVIVCASSPSTTNMVTFSGYGDSGGTATYNDNILFANNTLYGSGTDARGIRLSSDFCTSIASIRFLNNKITAVGAGVDIYSGTNVTNPNVMVFGNRHDLALIAALASYPADSPVATLQAATQFIINSAAAGTPNMHFYVNGADRAFVQYDDGSTIMRVDSDGHLDLAANNTLAMHIDTNTDITISAGHLLVGTAGKGLKIKEGSNAKMGTAVLVGGAVTVSTTAVTANSRIQVTSQVDGGTPGWLRVDTRTASTSFHIQSSSGTDTSTVAWLIIEPS